MQDARILVVEDEPLVAQDIRINLESLGYRVVGCVDSGRAAIKQAGKLRPDLILMDILLSDEVDGIDAARQIGDDCDIPVVYLTAFADDSFLERAKITDPLGYILKPFTQRELLAVIEMALYRAATERSLQNLFWAANSCASVPDPLIAIDMDLRISFLNQAACEGLGLSGDALIGKPWGEVLKVLPSLRSLKLRPRLQACIKDGQRWHSAKVVQIERDGVSSFVIPVIEPVYRREKHILGAMLLLQDVTQRRIAEEDARQHEHRALQYLTLSGAMLIALDLDDKVTLANPAACAVLGYSEDKIVGADWFQKFIPKRGRTEARSLVRRIQTTSEKLPVQAESRVLTRSGEERVVMWTMTPIVNVTGAVVGVLGSGMDMTDHRRLQMAVERSRDFYLSLLEHLPVMVWRSDVTGKFDYFNAAWLGFTGKTLNEEVDGDWMAGVHPDDIETVKTRYQAAFESREAFSLEYRLRNKDGQYHTMIDIGHPFYDLEHHFAGYIGGSIDVEQKQRTARDLRSLGRALQVLSGANEALVRARSDEGLLQEICEIIVNKGEYRMAWIGLAERDAARSVRPVAAAGVAIKAIGDLNVSWGDNSRGQGPTGRAIRAGSPAVMRHPSETTYAPWREAAQRFGYASSAAFPIRLAGDVVGAVNIYAHESDAFDADELHLLSNLADDLSFGLNALHERRLLAELTTRNETILQTARDGFWVIGMDGRILEVNDAYCELAGYSPKELQAMNVADIEVEEAPGEVAARIKTIEQRGHLLFHAVHRTKSDSKVEVEINAVLANLAKDSFIFAFMRDISERQQTERALLESETKYRAIFELANDAICLIHNESFVDCNMRSQEMFGATRDRLIGESPIRLSPELQPDGRRSADAIREFITRAYAGEPLYFEWRYQRSDGEIFDAEVSLNRIRIANQAYLQAIVRDVTERKAVDEALRSAYGYLDALYQTSPDMIFLHSPDGRLVDVNDNVLTCFGYTRQQVLELDMTRLYPTDVATDQVQTVLQGVLAGEALDFDWVACRKDGTRFPVEVRLRRLSTDIEGMSTKILAIVRDLSEIRRVEAQLKAILDFSPALISIKDLHGTIKLVNRRFDVITGGDVAEIVGKTAVDLFGRDAADEYASNDQRVVASREPLFAEEVIKHSDGQDHVYLSVKFPLIDESTKLATGVGAISTDITERKQTERVLQRERDFSAAVLDTIGSVVVVMDREGKIVKFNQAAQQLTGWSERDMLGHYLWDELLLPEQVDEVKAVFGRLTTGRYPNQYVNYWRTKSGDKRLFDWSNTVLSAQDGQVEYVIATGIDITARQQAQEGLARVEMQWNQAIDFFVDPVYFVDMQDRVVRANAAFYSLTGLSPEQVIGRNMTDVMHPEGEEKPCPVCAARRAQRDAIVTMEADQAENPMKRPVEIMVRMIREAPDAKPIGILMGIRDLTRQRQIEEELRRHRDHLEELVEERTQALATVNQELEAFSYSVSHDLRAPLRAIDGFSQVLMEEYGSKLDTKASNYLARVRNSSLRMSQLIDDLLMLSRVTRNEMHRQTVDLSAIAESVVEVLRESSPKRHVQVDIQPGLIAQADARLIRIVLENLLGNAWKFTANREQPEIHFRQEPDSQGGAYVVEDNGVGFDMAYVDRMFSAFQRLHADREFEGTGIGLATVQRIVHRHGGRVYARGRPDQGAQIFFTVPDERSKSNTAGDAATSDGVRQY